VDRFQAGAIECGRWVGRILVTHTYYCGYKICMLGFTSLWLHVFVGGSQLCGFASMWPHGKNVDRHPLPVSLLRAELLTR
jgi:hypothetical protein